jgi:hypothetical protein
VCFLGHRVARSQGDCEHNVVEKNVIEARHLSCGSSPGRTSSLAIAHGVGPFQENKPPKYKLSSEEKASGLEGFKFWNYLAPTKLLQRQVTSS